MMHSEYIKSWLYGSLLKASKVSSQRKDVKDLANVISLLKEHLPEYILLLELLSLT